MGLAVAATLLASGLSPSSALASLVAEIKPMRRNGARLSYALPKGTAVLVDSDNDVIIARVDRSVYAFSIRCPHKGARLQWREAEGKIYCPKHKARFDAKGEHVSGRRSRNLDRYAIEVQAGTVVVDTDSLFREDQNGDRWRAAVITT
jgi:nitrite reductase/ring-hydroxylating ferredoxin subunit